MEQCILNKYGSLYPSRILEYFITDVFFQKEHEKYPFPFVILGRSGPTGKSWLCTRLKAHGFAAVEISESILPFVDYRDNRNHVIVDGVNHAIVIVLNQNLKGE